MFYVQLYRHPHGNISTFMDYLNSTIEKVHRERKHCIVMGDLNIDLLKCEEHQQSDLLFLTLAISFNLQESLIILKL